MPHRLFGVEGIAGDPDSQYAPSCSFAFARDPFSDEGRAMKQLGSFFLARAQEADHIQVYDGDVLQIQGDLGAAHPHLVQDLAEMLRPHAPDQADVGSLPIRSPLELQHPTPLIRLGRKESAREFVTRSNNGPSENSNRSEGNADFSDSFDPTVPSWFSSRADTRIAGGGMPCPGG